MYLCIIKLCTVTKNNISQIYSVFIKEVRDFTLCFALIESYFDNI